MASQQFSEIGESVTGGNASLPQGEMNAPAIAILLLTEIVLVV